MLSNYIIHLYWLNKQLEGAGNKQLKRAGNKQLEGAGNKQYWETFFHNGLMFPPEYESIKIPIIYEDKEIILNSEAEEAATFYARYIDTEYVKNNKFNKNFWKDFKKLLDPALEIHSFENINFSKIKKYLENEREQKINQTKKQKEDIKKKHEKLEDKFLFAIIDGKKQPIGNFKVEPPGLFLGRGCHPKTGKIKKRIYPEDITINIGINEEIPDTGFKNRNWKEIVHDNTVIWLASWKEEITGKMKYVRLSDKSDYKSESDRQKFDLARKLKKKLGEIRKVNEDNLNSDNLKTKQLATALYFIENLSLRVGNEKGKNEADTVGVTSLRIEHIELLEKNKVKLDFLGKDSVRYTKKFEVIDIIYRNLNLFMQDKDRKKQLFAQINPSDLNSYLQEFMKGLTSKVFRTMNASKLFQKELNKITSKFQTYDNDDKINLLLDEFNKANAKVALLCNHQKNVNKNFKDQFININNKIQEAKQKIKDLENKKKIYKEKGKDTKSIKQKIIKKDSKIKQLKSKKTLKLEMKNVSLGTSKINYIDPRITIAFMKKNNIEINKLFTSALQDKFTWALEVETNYIF